MKILVLGDGFTDRYHLASTSRLSAEAPIPVCKIADTLDFPGGALNVQQNLKSLGAEAKYLYIPNQNFPVKNRLVVGDHQLARWDERDFTHPYTELDMFPLADGQWDAVVVSDYAKGSISEEVIQYLRSTGLPLFVDTKCDPRPWIGSDAILFPNRAEYRAFEELYAWFPNVILKLSSDGVALVQYGKIIMTRPSIASTVRSVNGAGDTALAGFVVASLSGARVEFALEFAMAASAVACEQPFTYAPSEAEVARKLYDRMLPMEAEVYPI